MNSILNALESVARHARTLVLVAVADGEFTVKWLYQRTGRAKLRAANGAFPDIKPAHGQTIEVWGMVTSSIKRFQA